MKRRLLSIRWAFPAILLALFLSWAALAKAQSVSSAVSREFSLFNNPTRVTSPGNGEAISREFSLFNNPTTVTTPGNGEAISREFSLFNNPTIVTSPSNGEAISREFSLYNSPLIVTSPGNGAAISREFSFYNNPTTVTSPGNGEAISREFSIFRGNALSINDAVVNEGDAGTVNAVFTVSLSDATGQAVTVQYSTANGTATTANNDYQFANGTLSFAAGETSKTITVLVQGDTVSELNEKFVVNLSNATNATISKGQGIGTILNDDGSTECFPAPSGLVSWWPGDGNALDIVGPNNGTLQNGATFSAGKVGQAFSFDGIDDISDAPIQGLPLGSNDRTLDLWVKINNFSSPYSEIAGYGNFGTAGESYSLALNGTTHEIYFSQWGQQVTGPPLKVDTWYHVAVSSVNNVHTLYLDGMAVAVGTLPTNTTSTNSRFCIGSLPINYDNYSRLNGAVDEVSVYNRALSISEIQDIYSAGSAGKCKDEFLTPSISVNDVTLTEGSGGTSSAVFTATLSKASAQTVTVKYFTSDGTATAPADYTAIASNAPGTLTFAPGETTKTIAVSVATDTMDEGDEIFYLNLSNASGANLGDSLGAATINDDDAPPTLSVGDVQVNEGNTGTIDAKFPITLSAPSGKTVTVGYSTNDGTAISPGDYTALPLTVLSFAPGETSKVVAVAVQGDTVNETDETFSLRLIQPGNATLNRDSGTGTIINDDSITLGVSDVSVDEGNTGTVNARFTLSLSVASLADVKVHYATAPETATSGSDYTATSGDATIPAGQTGVTVDVPVRGDVLNEDDETFQLNLSAPQGATLIKARGIGTIRNDDLTPPQLSVNDANGDEGDVATQEMLFRVTLSAPSGKTVTVRYKTEDGTATTPADYVYATGILTFAPGETSQDVYVAAQGDTLTEGDETFALKLSEPTNATLGDDTGIGTIRDDDAPKLSINDVSVREGDTGTTNATFTVTLSTPQAAPVTVNYATAPGTATSPNDFTATQGTLTFAPNQTSQTLAVAVKGEKLFESDETFFVNLSNATPTTVGLSDAQGRGTIENDDAISYRATVQTGVGTANIGSYIALSGSALDKIDGSKVADADVSVRILTSGTRRVLTAHTNANGDYTTTFIPLPKEAGHYELAADHPAVITDTIQDEFDLVGLESTPPTLSIDLSPGAPARGQLTLKNLGVLAQTELTATLQGAPANVSGQLSVAANIAVGESLTLDYSFSASDVSVRQKTAQIHLTTLQGAVTDVPVEIRISPLTPRLVANPGSLSAAMLRGSQKTLSFEVSNLGSAPSGELSVLLPEVPWLSLSSTQKVPSLAPSENATITLNLTPAATLALGPYTGRIVVSAAATSLNVDFRFTAVSNLQGGLKVTAEDEYSYYAEGKPKLAGATVTLSDPVTGETIQTGVTGAGGGVFFPDVVEANYNLSVRADKHGEYRSTVLVSAGETKEVTAFLPRQTVTYTWTVTPTDIPDDYDFTLDTTFETDVPIPVITVDPPSLDLSKITAGTTQINFTITNHGLIAAQGVNLTFGTHPNWKFTVLGGNIGDLAAKSSVVVPVVIQKIGGNSNAIGADVCSIDAGVDWYLVCGNKQWYRVPLHIFNVGGECGGLGGNGGNGGDSGNGNGTPGDPFVTPPSFDLPNFCDCKSLLKILPCLETEFGVDLDGIAGEIVKMLTEVSKKLPKGVFFDEPELEVSIKGKLCPCCVDGKISFEADLEVKASAKLKLIFGAEFETPDFEVPGFDILEFDLGGKIEGLAIEGDLEIGGTLKKECFKDPVICVKGEAGLEISHGYEIEGEVDLHNPITGKDFTGEVTGNAKISGRISAYLAYCDGKKEWGGLCRHYAWLGIEN